MKCASQASLNWNFQTSLFEGWKTVDNPVSISRWYSLNYTGTQSLPSLSTSSFSLPITPPLPDQCKLWGATNARTMGFRRVVSFAQDWEIVGLRMIFRNANSPVVLAMSQNKSYRFVLMPTGNICIQQLIPSALDTWCTNLNRADIKGVHMRSNVLVVMSTNIDTVYTLGQPSADIELKITLTDQGQLVGNNVVTNEIVAL